ncbi:hypothetical protein Phi19:2_gp091 [Cellulophaga phage phi19:2]|uniref:Uncharacterized protein n=3 Tax=Cellulophaga phage phiST TaxID=756282 RepID=M4SL66_9CAUD|nr:hypothetical protein CGPG_00019 [Cellulophaga phage phiST]AGH56718.1 hypothetical protein CGPG_00019 [Cellulophaga phage phiST]AGO47230.1 hypothetical protein PhiST_gp091 [Cellulophaga phage phiST]AGO48726.1 hypothetical protein Phi19:2_gp091 [Cellulophaga phage phi19:2]AGO49096.1 hypothetical protein Phi13:1_gp085 [Cellulophaga phage phi13:1]
MFTFVVGVLVGGLGLFLILDNNPKLAAKLSSVKDVVEAEIDQRISNIKNDLD